MRRDQLARKIVVSGCIANQANQKEYIQVTPSSASATRIDLVAGLNLTMNCLPFGPSGEFNCQ